MDPKALRRAIAGELEDNLLPFWRDRSPDHERGGFIGEMSSDGVVRPDAPRGLILNSRLLWAFSALFRELGDARDLVLARRAFDVLDSSFRDRDNGGYVWRVDADGRPLDRSKKIYGQAFCIYALSEFHRATGDPTALERARQAFVLIDDHAHDDRFGGYIEARAADWSEIGDLRLSDKDMNAAKSMNNHLHLVEGFTNLARVTEAPGVASRLGELIAVFDRHILSREPADRHLHHFFDERWNRCSDSRTFGHDIEAAWLLGEAAEVLADARVRTMVDGWAVELARSVLARGMDGAGGIAYEGRDDAVVNGDHDWWCQAEAVVGFWHAYGLTRATDFADAAAASWRFIDRNMVDRVRGEWFWRVRADGVVDTREPKVSEWKGPYHSVRMCLEMMRRLGDAGGATP
jgi:mannobiose 2-epimerase